MAIAAKPVLSFISKQYPSDSDAEQIERGVAHSSMVATPAKLATAKPTLFTVKNPAPRQKLTQSLRCAARISDLEKIRKHLRQPRLGANRIGDHAFQYFLKQEGLA